MNTLIFLGVIAAFAIAGYLMESKNKAAKGAGTAAFWLLGCIPGAVFWIVIIAGVAGLIYYYIVN